MREVLNKIHNLQINCTTKKEMYYILRDLTLDHREYKDLICSSLSLAAECTVLPIYYLQATKSGMRQDRDGNFYKETK
jgi:hypothetical protein